MKEARGHKNRTNVGNLRKCLSEKPIDEVSWSVGRRHCFVCTGWGSWEHVCSNNVDTASP